MFSSRRLTFKSFKVDSLEFKVRQIAKRNKLIIHFVRENIRNRKSNIGDLPLHCIHYPHHHIRLKPFLQQVVPQFGFFYKYVSLSF